MSWADAALWGGFALAGVALQQSFASHSARLVYQRNPRIASETSSTPPSLTLYESAGGFSGHSSTWRGPLDSAAVANLAYVVDALAETVAAVRLVVADEALVEQVEAFEEHAKALERRVAGLGHLKLTPLIEVLRAYEARH